MAGRPARLWLLALPLALVTLLGAGCGGDDPAPADDEPGAEAPEQPGEQEGDEANGGSAPEPANERSRRVLEACREIVDRAPGLSEEARRDLVAECEDAAADDAEAARSAAAAACDAIAAATVPAPLRGPAADACRRAIPDGALL